MNKSRLFSFAEGREETKRFNNVLVAVKHKAYGADIIMLTVIVKVRLLSTLNP